MVGSWQAVAQKSSAVQKKMAESKVQLDLSPLLVQAEGRAEHPKWQTGVSWFCQDRSENFGERRMKWDY